METILYAVAGRFATRQGIFGIHKRNTKRFHNIEETRSSNPSKQQKVEQCFIKTKKNELTKNNLKANFGIRERQEILKEKTFVLYNFI